jgi:hypothetical protein
VITKLTDCVDERSLTEGRVVLTARLDALVNEVLESVREFVFPIVELMMGLLQLVVTAEGLTVESKAFEGSSARIND